MRATPKVGSRYMNWCFYTRSDTASRRNWCEGKGVSRSTGAIWKGGTRVIVVTDRIIKMWLWLWLWLGYCSIFITHRVPVRRQDWHAKSEYRVVSNRVIWHPTIKTGPTVGILVISGALIYTTDLCFAQVVITLVAKRRKGETLAATRSGGQPTTRQWKWRDGHIGRRCSRSSSFKRRPLKREHRHKLWLWLPIRAVTRVFIVHIYYACCTIHILCLTDKKELKGKTIDKQFEKERVKIKADEYYYYNPMEILILSLNFFQIKFSYELTMHFINTVNHISNLL